MTPAVEQKQPGTELSVAQRAQVALGTAEHEKKLTDMATQSKEIVVIKDKVSYDQCHGTRMALKRARISIETTGKTAREDAQAFSKAIIAEEKRLIGIISPEETRLESIQDAHDAEVARKKEEAARAERERIERTQAAIRDIRDALIDVAGRGAQAIEAKIRELVALECATSEFQEFQGEAIIARDGTLAKLRDMHAAAVAQETEAARLAAERVDLERRQAEQAERERQEQERAAAETRQREEDAATRRRALEEEERASRARIEEQERQARAAREQADRDAQALRDAEAARLKAAQDRIDAERRALEDRQREERDAAEAKARAEREADEERQRQERLAIEQREREEREARETAEREAREAELARMREEQRKANELLDGREMLATFKARFGVHAEFAGVIKAIDLYLVPRSKSQVKRIAAQTS